MVPCHPFNEMKPNSGSAAAEPGRSNAESEFKKGSERD
jgi:hypothetical protein